MWTWRCTKARVTRPRTVGGSQRMLCPLPKYVPKGALIPNIVKLMKKCKNYIESMQSLGDRVKTINCNNCKRNKLFLNCNKGQIANGESDGKLTHQVEQLLHHKWAECAVISKILMRLWWWWWCNRNNMSVWFPEARDETNWTKACVLGDCSHLNVGREEGTQTAS